MPLVDHRGRPLNKDDLLEEQAGPTITGVRSVVPSTHIRNLTPFRLDSILTEAEVPGPGSALRYIELAEVMEERDLHYLGVLGTRRRQVSQIGVRVEPASDSAEHVADADLARSFLARPDIEDELFDLMDAVGKGFSVCEIVWDMSENQWMPACLKWRDQRWFDFDQDTGSRLLLRGEDGGSAELAQYKFAVHRFRAKSGLDIRGGFARAAAWSWLFKNFAVKDWVRFVEAYGQPMRLGRYGAGATDEDRKVLYRAIANISSDAAAMVPEDMSIEFIADTTVRGRSEVYRELLAYLDSRMSIAVLGQTLTSEQGDSGSYALGAVHNQVRGDIERADGRQLAATLTRDIAVPLVVLNQGRRDAYPRVIIERKEAKDTKAIVDATVALLPYGLRVKMDEMRALLGLSPPEEGDEVLEAPDAPMSNAPAMARTEDGGLASTARAERNADAIDLAVQHALDDWRPLMDPVIDPILAAAREHLEAGGDLTSFRELLPSLFERMDETAMAQHLGRLQFTAALSGRAIRGDGDGGT